jgi:hypothetical protein
MTCPFENQTNNQQLRQGIVTGTGNTTINNNNNNNRLISGYTYHPLIRANMQIFICLGNYEALSANGNFEHKNGTDFGVKKEGKKWTHKA